MYTDGSRIKRKICDSVVAPSIGVIKKIFLGRIVVYTVYLDTLQGIVKVLSIISNKSLSGINCATIFIKNQDAICLSYHLNG